MKSARFFVNKIRGFTLIELLVVIAVLAVIAAGVVVGINPARRIAQANDAKVRNDIGQIATALQGYFTENQFYPALLSDLVPNDLKQVPPPPAGGTGSYADNYSRTGGCATPPYTGCEATIYWKLGAPKVATKDLWCWRSSTGTSSEETTCPNP